MAPKSGSAPPTPKELERRVCVLEKGKVGKDVYNIAKINLEKDVDEIKSIALSAKTKAENPHRHCNKVEDVEEMKKQLDGFGKVKIAAIIALIIFVGSTVASYTRTQVSVEAMDETVKEMKEDREKRKKKKQETREQKQARIEEQTAIVTAAVKAAFKEAQPVRADIQPDRRRRNTR